MIYYALLEEHEKIPDNTYLKQTSSETTTSRTILERDIITITVVIIIITIIVTRTCRVRVNRVSGWVPDGIVGRSKMVVRREVLLRQASKHRALILYF